MENGVWLMGGAEFLLVSIDKFLQMVARKVEVAAGFVLLVALLAFLHASCSFTTGPPRKWQRAEEGKAQTHSQRRSSLIKGMDLEVEPFNILITGANGYVASHFIATLNDKVACLLA